MQINKDKLNPNFEGYKLCSLKSPLFYIDEEKGAAIVPLPSIPLITLKSASMPLSFKQSKYIYDFNHLFSLRDNIFYIDEDHCVQLYKNGAFISIYDLSKISQTVSTNKNIINEEPSIYMPDDDIIIVNNGSGSIQIINLEEKSLLKEPFSLHMTLENEKKEENEIRYLPSIILCSFCSQDSIHVVLQSSFDYARTKDINTDDPKRKIEFFVTVLVFNKKEEQYELQHRYDLVSNNPAKGCLYMNSEQPILTIVSESAFWLKGSLQQNSITDSNEVNEIPQEQNEIMTNRLTLFTSEVYDTTFDESEDVSRYVISTFSCHTETPEIKTEASSESKPLLLAQGKTVGISHDVHMCMFKIEQTNNDLKFSHEMSFSALSYVLRGKEEKKFLIADMSLRMCIIAEHHERLYIYDANMVDKMQKSEHQVIDIGDADILGVRILNGELYVLTNDSLDIFPVNKDKLATLKD